jgi:hypothetical protein
MKDSDTPEKKIDVVLKT